MPPILVILATQALFTCSDILARYHMKSAGWSIATFTSAWFALYTLIRVVAMFGQLYVFSAMELGRTTAVFAAASIVIANIAGLLLLGENLSGTEYAGVVLAVLAIALIALR